jgi:hypothetical protein
LYKKYIQLRKQKEMDNRSKNGEENKYNATVEIQASLHKNTKEAKNSS